MPYAMKIASATAVNLNLLSSDVYTLLIGLFVFHYSVSNIDSDSSKNKGFIILLLLLIVLSYLICVLV